jgi:hypothetical protein
MGILRLARHFKLERDMIINEKKLKSKFNKELPQVNAMTGDLTRFIYDKQSIEELTKKDYIQYTKINFVQADITHFNDIKDNHALE